MGARRSTLLLLTAAGFAVACGEQPRDSVTGPEFKPGPPPGTCDFSGLAGLVRNYFPGPRQNAIVTLVGSMQTAGQQTPDARTFGFQIMDSIGFLSRDASVTTDPAAGAALTVGLINNCMFDASGFTYPTTPLADFTNALNQHAGGAYFVRGGTAGREKIILATKSTGGDTTNLSGIKPSSDTWANMVKNSSGENRALFFGYVFTDSPLTYEWATVPSNTTFEPNPAVVAVCDNTGSSTTAMVNESSIGVLAFTDGNALCAETQTLVTTEPGWGPRALAARLARTLVGAVTPSPLYALRLVTTSGSGGTASTFKSKFSTNTVGTLNVVFKDAPKNPWRISAQPFPVSANVSFVEGTQSTGVFGVCVYLTATNNNGQPTDLQSPVGHDSKCTSPPTGPLVPYLSVLTKASSVQETLADFGNVTITKTGGLALTVTADVIDRDGSGSRVAKINVKP
jgi:hypothetical protein